MDAGFFMRHGEEIHVMHTQSGNYLVAELAVPAQHACACSIYMWMRIYACICMLHRGPSIMHIMHAHNCAWPCACMHILQILLRMHADTDSCDDVILYNQKLLVSGEQTKLEMMISDRPTNYNEVRRKGSS
jgi:hypothetical protein